MPVVSEVEPLTDSCHDAGHQTAWLRITQHDVGAPAPHFGYEGRKLRSILRNSPTRRPELLGGVPKPLPSFAKATEGTPRRHPRRKPRG